MWGRKKIAGTVYDLTHLDPFIMDVLRPSGASWRVQVQFGTHTFTEKFGPLHTPDLAISDGKDLRAFCLTRYGHSFSLKAAVIKSATGHACMDSGRMLFSAQLPSLADPYLIAFKLRPKQTTKFDAVMTIVSAHPRPNLNGQLPRAPFHAVVSATIAGRKIDWKKK